jgi:ABC-type proline/glycine betaine transport system permease subunit
LQKRVGEKQANSLRLLVEFGGHGAFVAAFGNRAEIVLAHVNRQSPESAVLALAQRPHVVLPQTMPFIFTAARTGLSLTWRIMIFVELLGRQSGVGYRIQYFYNLVDMNRVVAAALPFVALMLAFEFGALRPLERFVFRWRRTEAQ